jgi:UrcA family protein
MRVESSATRRANALVLPEFLKESVMKANSITGYIGTGMLAFSATVGQAWMISTARAADAPSAQSLRITVSDLDLNKSSDVATLYQRIKSAAQQACGADVVTGSRLISGSKKQCLSQAVDSAVAQINNPSLSAYHKQGSTKAGA